MHVKTDWIIEGRLDGEILADEGVARGRVSIPLNLKDGHLLGGVHTSGGEFGGSASGELTAGRLDLRRAR